MKNLIFILILFIVILSCNSEKRAIKKLANIRVNHPQLFEETRDTTYYVAQDSSGMFRDTLSSDAIVTMEPSLPGVPTIDTFIIEGPERVVTRVIVERDTFIKLVVNTKVLPDSIPVYIRVPVEVIKEKVITKTKVVKRMPFWTYLVGGFLMMSFVGSSLIIYRLSKKD